LWKPNYAVVVVVVSDSMMMIVTTTTIYAEKAPLWNEVDAEKDEIGDAVHRMIHRHLYDSSTME